MSEIVILTALAFVAGFAWSFRKPAGSCMMSTAQQHGVINRIRSGLINGGVFGGIVLVITVIVFA